MSQENTTNKDYRILWVLLALAICIFTIWYFNRTDVLKKSADKHLKDAKLHGDTSKVYMERYKGQFVKDSVLERKYDSLIKIKQKIKIQTNEKLKLVDKYSISDMQYYFDDRTRRTKKSSDPR